MFELGEYYVRNGLVQKLKCVFIGNNYALLHREDQEDGYNYDVMAMNSDVENGYWKEVPKKQTVYVSLLRYMNGSISYHAAREVSFAYDAFKEPEWTIIACHKLELEEGVFCDEWKQVIADKPKGEFVTQHVDYHGGEPRIISTTAEKDRSDAGDKAIVDLKFDDGEPDF